MTFGTVIGAMAVLALLAALTALGSARCTRSSPRAREVFGALPRLLPRPRRPEGRPLADHWSSRIVTNIEIANSASAARASST